MLQQPFVNVRHYRSLCRKVDSPLFNRRYFSRSSPTIQERIQLEMNVKIPTVTNAGFDIGTKIRQIYSKSLAPSILAALKSIRIPFK